MHRWLPLALALLPGLVAVPSGAQEASHEADPPHVAVEATTVVMDQARMRRLGLDHVVLTAPGSAVAVSEDGGTSGVRVGSRIGGLEIRAWLDLARRDRAVQRESTQRILVLSGSEAELSSHRALVGGYGSTVRAGPGLWVQPLALEDGRVRLRFWAAEGDVRTGRWGILEERVPVETSTEIIVPSGTPVLVASTESAEQRAERGLVGRGSASSATQAWIVVTPRVVSDPAEAFPLPGTVLPSIRLR